MIAQLKSQIGDFGKDTRLNFGTVLTLDGAPDLSEEEIWGISLAVAYSLNHSPLIETIEAEATPVVSEEVFTAAKSAASIMAMNNIYYRSIHLLEDAELTKLPARLRMNVIGSPGVGKKLFELMSFAVSAVNGCGQCLTSHSATLKKEGATPLALQSTLRIAAVLNAVKTSLQLS